MKTNRKYYKKKSNIGTWILSIIVLILVGGLAYASGGFMNWDLESWKDQFTLPVVPGSSSEEPDTSEEAVFDIANRPNHIMYAVNDTVVLTVTVTPANAANKTVVWNSSNSSYVSVTPLTENTARLTCLSNFVGSVIITATATQGTSYTGDDVTATCTVTYDHPLESIDIQLWNYGSTPSMNGAAVQVATTTEITDFTNWYALRVFLTPSLPSNAEYTLSNIGDVDIEDFTTIENIANYNNGQAFKFNANTPPEKSINVSVMSADGIHDDAIALTIGQHLGVSGRQITGSVQVWSNDRATMLNSYASFSDLIVAVQTQGKSWLAGVYIYINVNGMSYVQPNYDISFNTSYFGYVAAGSTNMSNPSSGVARVTNPANNATLVLYALASTSGTANVTIDPTNYASTFLNQQLPFVLTEPVTGLSIDQPNVTF